MNRRALGLGGLLIFPIGVVGAATSIYAHFAFAAYEREIAGDRGWTADTPAGPEVQLPAVGDSVLAPWGAGDWLYPAVVVGPPSGDHLPVAFEDGDRGTVPLASVRAVPSAPNARVSVRRDGEWSPPKEIATWTGEAAYPDVVLGNVRFAPADVEEGPGRALDIDAWVRFREEGPAYPAEILLELQSDIAVVFADGDHGIEPVSARVPVPSAGDAMEVQLPGESGWGPATLIGVHGRAVRVRAADGATLVLAPAAVRIPSADDER